jgi:hypothetical protein
MGVRGGEKHVVVSTEFLYGDGCAVALEEGGRSSELGGLGPWSRGLIPGCATSCLQILGVYLPTT